MKKILYILLLSILVNACSVSYSLSGVNVAKNIKTFQVDYFPNNASLVVPGINDDFRNMLIDKISQSTNLEEVKTGGDYIYEGEISSYDIQPVALTSEQTAAMNRLSISIKITFTNQKNDKDNYTKTYTYYYDYPANKSRLDIQDDAHQDIFKKILNDIFNDTLAKW